MFTLEAHWYFAWHELSVSSRLMVKPKLQIGLWVLCSLVGNNIKSWDAKFCLAKFLIITHWTIVWDLSFSSCVCDHSTLSLGSLQFWIIPAVMERLLTSLRSFKSYIVLLSWIWTCLLQSTKQRLLLNDVNKCLNQEIRYRVLLMKYCFSMCEYIKLKARNIGPIKIVERINQMLYDRNESASWTKLSHQEGTDAAHLMQLPTAWNNV